MEKILHVTGGINADGPALVLQSAAIPEIGHEKLLFVLAIFVVAVTGTHAKARNYPWCAYYSKGCTSCGFVNFEQCMADVSGIGGFCEPNTQYQAPASTVHPSHRAQKHYSHQQS